MGVTLQAPTGPGRGKHDGVVSNVWSKERATWNGFTGPFEPATFKSEREESAAVERQSGGTSADASLFRKRKGQDQEVFES